MQPELIGYSDRPSVAPGETLAFKVSTDAPEYEVAIVRLIHGDAYGPGFKEEVVSVLGKQPGRKQATFPGSFAVVSDDAALGPESFTLAAFIYPTTATTGAVQGLVARWRDDRGYALVLDAEGVPGLWIGDGADVTRLAGGEPLRSRQWYFVAATFDAETGTLTLRQTPLSRWPIDRRARSECHTSLRLPQQKATFSIAALSVDAMPDGRVAPRNLYNGKIEAPMLFDRALDDDELERFAAIVPSATARLPGLVAAWDFSLGIASPAIRDVGPARLHGRLVNMPTRAVTGRMWSGDVYDYRHAADQYGAIHFHDDDLEDAGWATDFTWQVPADVRSGFYAARLQHGGQEDHIPFFVRPARGAARAKAVVLAPTFTYLAYACERLKALPLHAAAYAKRPMVKDPLDLYLEEHPEFGNSLYDSHSDRSGCSYSTWRRPITSMRPKYRQWQVASPRHLGADLYLIDWLETKGIAYDVVTDHDLHAEGAALLEGYKVLLTGSHPEYWSGPMLDAVETYLDAGGHQMYLGGNGYYWVTAADPERPHIVEIRRGNAGSRAWNSEPGELHFSTTGEQGGLWRHRGRPPNRIAGIGFAAMGYDAPTPGYRRLPGSFDPRARFIFEGVGDDEIIGNFGLYLGGAAGDEIDRLNYDLGSPPHTLLLARAEGHDQSVYMPVVEDYAENSSIVIAAQAKTVSADITYFETAEGGAVFAAGAISWFGSLSHNGYDNNVSRITENVLRRFLR